MRIFVAGATGAIGRCLLPRLLDAGHHVTAMTRSPERARRLSALGATPAVCDVYDTQALSRVVTDAAPDVVVHLLTDLPHRLSLRASTASTDRLRREGTRNLLAAARAAGVRRVIAESIAFLYEPDGERIKDERAAPYLDAPRSIGAAVAAVVDLERQVLAADGMVLRFGCLYGPGTWFARDGSIARAVGHRCCPIVGRGTAVLSFVHVDDAAAAALAALERGSSGVYNVVDDEPAPMRDWLPAYAASLGARRPLRVPAALVRLIAGRSAATMATRMPGADNAKAKRELGWSPRYPSWRVGFNARTRP